MKNRWEIVPWLPESAAGTKRIEEREWGLRRGERGRERRLSVPMRREKEMSDFFLKLTLSYLRLCHRDIFAVMPLRHFCLECFMCSNSRDTNTRNTSKQNIPFATYPNFRPLQIELCPCWRKKSSIKNNNRERSSFLNFTHDA